jgi:hypothetical protein
MHGDGLGGMGGGGRLGGLTWTGVLSACRHWLIKGIIDDDEETEVDFDDREWISLLDFERLRIIPLVFIGDASGGEIDFVRHSFCSDLLPLQCRRDEWNDDERVNNVFDDLRRSTKKRIDDD